MKEKNQIELKKIAEQVNDIYQKVLNDTIELLKNCKTGRYIGCYEDSCHAVTDDYKRILEIRGVGLNDKNHICIKKMTEVFGESDYDSDWSDYGWVDIMSDNVVKPWVYPELYRFVAENIDSATSKLEASMIVDNYKGVVFDNKKNFDDYVDNDDIEEDYWFIGCSKDFLDEHNITLEEYGEIMYKTGNRFCFNSWNCEHCYNCNECLHCKDCKYCKDCTDCDKCEDCKDCKNCTDCNCCKDCENCSYTYQCDNCKDCKGCVKCEDCEDCVDCVECKGCHNCKGYEKIDALIERNNRLLELLREKRRLKNL